jgi:hypothetical protein
MKKVYQAPNIEYDNFSLRDNICSQLYSDLYSVGGQVETTAITPSYEGNINDAIGEIRPTRPRN